MTDHTRALLEQALEVIVANTTGKDALESAIRAELAKPTNADPECAESSVDYWQQRGYFGSPGEWREACRLFRVRCSPEDIQRMAKLRAYIEDGLLIVSRPDNKPPTPAPHDAPIRAELAKPVDIADEMSAVADQFAHRLALDLECVLADYQGTWYDTAINTLGAYRGAMNAIHERVSPTFMGEPLLPAIAKAEVRKE